MTAPLDETTIGAILAAAGTLVAVAVLVVVLVRRRRPLRIDSPEDAASAVETLLGADARVCGAVVGADGSGALAVTDDGRVAAVKRRGRRLVAHEVAWQAVRSIPGGILIETGDRHLGEVALTGVDALDIRRLAPRGAKA